MLGAIVLTTVLLVVGVVLRRRFRFLATARIPASLIAGALGLLVWQVLLWSVSNPALEIGESVAGPTAWTWSVFAFEKTAMANLRTWPGWLIAVVFAGMLLSRAPEAASDRDEKSGNGFSPVGREALMVWIIVLGQTVVGLWLVCWWVGPQFGLPPAAAMLIETGFAGGHGTAAAMGTVFSHRSIGLDEGLDLGILMATSGLVYGLVSGILWIEVGMRRGWVAGASGMRVGEPRAKPPQPEPVQSSLGEDEERVSRARIGDAIEPLLMQLVWLMLAFSIGLGLQWCVDSAASVIDASRLFSQTPVLDVGRVASETGDLMLKSRLQVASIVGSFPLFIYTLFGGAIVRFLVVKTADERWIDHVTINRLVGASMDLLVVAAVVTLNLAVVASLWVPMLGLFLGGAVWSTFCLLVLSRRILPESHWFELGLINFGMSTGTTATGFVLLRVIDPELRTKAAQQYALAAPLSAPFIGGGMITVGLPLLLLQRIPIAASAAGMTLVLAALVAWGVMWKRKLLTDQASPAEKTGADSDSIYENRQSR